MTIEMLMLVALAQAPSDAKVASANKATKASAKTSLSPQDAKLIDALVKDVVSRTRPAKAANGAASKRATSRPAGKRSSKAKPRIRVRSVKKATSRPSIVRNEKRPSRRSRRGQVGRRGAGVKNDKNLISVGKKPARSSADKKKSKATAAKAAPKAAPKVIRTKPRPERRVLAGKRSRGKSDASDRAEVRLIDSSRARAKVRSIPTTQQTMQALQEMPELSQLRGRVSIVATGPESIGIQGDPEAVAALENIIRILDAAEVPLKLEVYPLDNARAVQLAPMLSTLLRQMARVPGRRARPSDQIIVVPDARSNSLLIGAAPERMGEVRDIIGKLDSQPLIGPVQFRTFPLKNMIAGDAAELLQQMIQRLQAQRGVPGEAITIIPDDRTNTLIVTAPQADIEQVGKMIEMIDVEPAFATARMVHIPLMNADAQALSRVFAEMISQRMTGRRGRALAEQIRRLRLRTEGGRELPELDLEKPIKITAEPGTNSLLISSTESNLEAMEEMVKLLDAVPVAEAVVVRIFPLEDADATDIAKMLQTIFQQGKQLSTGPGGKRRGSSSAVPQSAVGEALMYNIGIAADTRTNILIVSGREEQIQLAQEVVDNLDKPGFASRWPIRMLPLEHTDAQRLAQMISHMMTQRLAALKRLGPTALERERVLVVADVRSNSLIIMAKDDNYEEIVELATKLDNSKSVAGDIRLVKLEKTQANVIAPKITQLWQRRAQLLAGGGSRDMPVIVTDERSNSLVVASNLEDFEAIEKLVKTIEEAPLAPIGDIRIIPIENSDASVLAPTLRQLFQERMQMRQTPGARALPSDRVAIMPDPVVNALLVACSNENFETLQALIKKLDVELPLEGMVKFFVLEHADATRVSQMIQRMFQKGLYKPGTMGKQSAVSKARDKVVIEADMRSNSLIVSASKENYTIIEKLLEEVDVEDAPFLEGNVMLYKVKYADAVKLGSMLEQVLQKMQSFRQRVGPELPVTVLSDESSNSLVISGSRDVLTQSKSLLVQLDQESDEPTREIKPYSLVHSSAAKVAQILEDLFRERGRGGGTGRASRGTAPFVRADETANILIVQASQEDHKIVAGLLELIDIKSEASERVRIFPLEQAQAEDLQTVIEDLYSQQRGPGSRGGRGAGPGISLSTDPQTNSLIVWASPSEMEDIAELVEKLDTTNPRDETRIKIFRLKQADAEDLAQVLEDILTGKSSGGARRGGAADSVLISYPGKTASGEEVIHKLIRRNVQIVPEKLTNSLLIRAMPESMKMLEELIETLDGIPPREVDVVVFPLINADADQMVKVLEKLFKVGDQARRGGRGQDEEQVMLTASAGMAGLAGESGPPGRQLLSFTPDTRTNSVIAAGTQEYLVLAEKLIRELDEQEIEQRTNMVYQVKFSKAEDLEKSLKAHFDNISKLYRDLDDEEAKLRQIEREVSVVADTTTESLLISASPRYESQVMKMINDLDRPPPQVMIQVLIAEVTLDESVELGMEFAIQDLLFSETAYLGNNGTVKGTGFDVVGGTDLGAAGAALGGFSFTITGEDFNFLLRALQTEGRLEVLSRPQLLAEDNVEANISIGQKVPFVDDVNIMSDGRTRTTVRYEDVGIILDVTPHINPDGYVSLEVEPEISAITDSSVQVTEGVFAPIFNKRTVKTTVTVKDGETIVIGGLITTQEERRETKVPILGDIPGLGNLFKATVTSKEKTELLFVLTPVVVRDEREARDLSEKERDKIDLLPPSIRSSPLMEKLRVDPEKELLAPVPDLPSETEIEPRTRVKPAGLSYGPSRPSYGPAKPTLISHRQPTPPKKMIGADAYESYLRQRR